MIKVFPNPSSEYININNVQTNNMVVAIYDIRGAKVSEFMLKDENNKISIKHLNKGFYTLEFVENGKKLKTEKLVIQ